MLSPDESKEALTRLFRRQQVADIDTVFRVLKTTSKMSAFRRLSALGAKRSSAEMEALGYLTSYSHNGRYYTLAEVPDFDGDGFWRFQGICFSRHGTLHATVEQLVQVSHAGHTHPELAVKLQVRVHNTLLDLYQKGRIGRELLQTLYLYVSVDVPLAATQLARRIKLNETVRPLTLPAVQPLIVIEILLEVIRGARIVIDPGTVRERLRSRSVDVSLEEIEMVYRAHGLKKTQD